ncbi:hypothetical protein RJ639_041670 [Escallonia herrerae]|uniref:FAD-binding PCMH-type domain-containing protein n=1 Tax=Escallonia herrerae TaxID=1293975 RepID=A0AA89B1V1_9ASTE|nr:hypothetical protein RJ639_041670 [Escallonia herrerae]
MRTSSFAVVLFISLCLSSSWVTADNSVYDNFLQCLYNSSQPSNSISGVIYTPSNSSYSSVLQSYIRNLRFNEFSTSKPLLIITALEVSDVPFFILDMFNLRSINVSIKDETAWVQTGATLGEVYYRAAEHNNSYGFPAGVCPTVGVGGHFGGAGYGNMMRKYGLSVDNIIDAQIIDVNGNLLDRASMGEDLFWAITGEGGSSFE